MQDEPGNPESALRTAGSARPESEAAPAPTSRSWRGLWQVPALLGAAGLLTAGVAALLIGAPDPDLDLLIDRAESFLGDHEYQSALDELNITVRPWYDGGVLTPEQRRRFHLLRARAVYLGQKEAGLDLPENARTIADEYAAAARDVPLADPRDIYYLADANVTLGAFERALELARRLPLPTEDDPVADGRARIFRRIVEQQLRDPAAPAELSLRLLSDFLADTSMRTADRAWALARQSQILISQGSHDAAIARLLRTMPALLPELAPEDIGELHLLLGRAYIESGALSDAARQLTSAIHCLLDTDERWARAMVLLARIEEATGQPSEEARIEARQKYLTVVGRFDGSDERLPALLGLGEIEAALGEYEASLSAFSRLIDGLMDGGIHPDATREITLASLLSRWRGLFEVGEIEMALRYAALAERLGRIAMERGEPGVGPPPEVLIAIARSHRALADQPLPGGGAPETREHRARRIADLDSATRQSIRTNLASAGRYYKMHADSVGISDNAAFGESLWAASEAFDLAGDLDAAIPLLADYVKYFPGDPRRAEARFRLARAYQARGDYTIAAENFRSLIADARALGPDASQPGAVTGVGPFADLSVVPLAQVLLLDADPDNDHEAESLLGEVVSGRIGSANTPQFRDGLVELGLLLYRRGEYAAAIERLEEAVTRFPADPQIESVRYSLAEANRQDAGAIRRTLAEAMPEHRKQLLEQTRLTRLRRAEALYEQVRRALEARAADRRTRLERTQLRNSYFYLGDCAFELADYDVAIQRYDAARERFPDDPAALVAMVQIVNAYVEQGDMQRAATANERARRFYQSLPETAWNDPDLPMTQQDWQRWLDSMTALRPVRGSATAGVEDDGR